jgi:colanic acid/amylovoran biosynthesis glycosyltransferase
MTDQKPLRIAVMAHEFPALSETFVLNHVTGLLDLGHDVTVLATAPRADELTQPDVVRYGLADGTVYRRMPKNPVLRAALAPLLVLRRRGGEGPVLDVRHYGREARSLSLLYWADRLRRLAPFDVVHCHFGIVGRTAAYLRELNALEGKLVVTFHGVDVSATLDSDPHTYDHLFHTGDLFLPISELWRDRLIDQGCPPERTLVHRVGIDVGAFDFRPRDSWVRPLRVLAVGRLVEKKGFRYALEAVAQVRWRGLDAELTILGDGPLRNELTALTAREPLVEHVRFLGWQDGSAVRRLYEQSDVLLAPSVTDASGDKEGIPVTLMEAMASGLPVVSTRHSGIPELVEHGVSGLLVPERDVDALASALLTLAESPMLARRLAVQARATIERGFEYRALNDRLVEMYRALLRGETPVAAVPAVPQLDAGVGERYGDSYAAARPPLRIRR